VSKIRINTPEPAEAEEVLRLGVWAVVDVSRAKGVECGPSPYTVVHVPSGTFVGQTSIYAPGCSGAVRMVASFGVAMCSTHAVKLCRDLAVFWSKFEREAAFGQAVGGPEIAAWWQRWLSSNAHGECGGSHRKEGSSAN
jgi:hypothetical protein